MTDVATYRPGKKNTPLQVGLVLRLGHEAADPMVRITHVFNESIFVMPVSTPDKARYAKRPYELQVSKVESRLDAVEWQIGRLSMPSGFLTGDGDWKNAYEVIQPLIEVFDDKRSLSRTMFTVQIKRRANELGVSEVTLRRLLLRFYYFGRVKEALQPLKPGRPIEETSSYSFPTKSGQAPKRRGPQPITAIDLGPNDFVVSTEDIEDMVECYERLAANDKVTRTKAYKEYFRTYFAKRHPEKYADFMNRKCPRPVTLRQYREYTDKHVTFTRDMAKNAGRTKREVKGATLAVGPAEYYEIDATGGRIHVVDSENPDVVLKTPLIYLIIDRWSRFIVSLYVTLRPASWEEIRLALLIAFTSRERRFKNLGANVDEERWPQGRICAHLVQDRGSEMISRAMLEAAVEGLHIEPETLPPLCPDGKGIIERCIRGLKARMTDRKLKGGFQERPLNPKAKRKFRAAKDAAVYSLRELYWELLDIVDDYNNSSHSHLEQMTILKRAGVRPTPRDAYLWGLENITGLETPPLTDEDYIKLLMSRDKATIASGVVNYRARKYYPANSAAMRQARLSTSRRLALEIKVDRFDPTDIYVPVKGGEWPMWRVSKSGLQQLQEITLEEEEQLGEQHRLLIAKTRDDSFIDETVKANQRRRRKGIPSAQPESAQQPVSAETRRRRRNDESDEIKKNLLGKSIAQPPTSATKSTKASESSKKFDGIALERQERLATIEFLRRRKS